jgi:hypothetical protein
MHIVEAKAGVSELVTVEESNEKDDIEKHQKEQEEVDEQLSHPLLQVCGWTHGRLICCLPLLCSASLTFRRP